METLNEFYVLASLNGCAVVYELSGCGIGSFYSNLNFKYCVCLKKRAPLTFRQLQSVHSLQSVYVT